MIDKVLKYLESDISQYLLLQGIEEDEGNQKELVKLSNIVDQKGMLITSTTVARSIQQKIFLTLLNVSPDDSKGGLGGATHNSDIPTNVVLYVLLAVYVKPDTEGVDTSPYELSLNILSKIIEYFQLNKVLNIPGLPLEAGNQVHTKLVKMSFDELSNIWSTMGAKYLPSVVYRLRSVSIKGHKVIEDAPPITKITIG